MRNWAIFSGVTILVCSGLWLGTSSNKRYCITADIGEKTEEGYNIVIASFSLQRRSNLLGTTDRLFRFDERCSIEETLFLHGYAVKHCLEDEFIKGNYIECPRPVNLEAIEFEPPLP